jgi:hypothetical protein
MPHESATERISEIARSVAGWALAAWMLMVCGFYGYFMLRDFWR